MSDFIASYPRTIDSETCQALIALYEATPDKIPSGTGINGHLQSIRRSAGISLDRQNGGKLFETVFHALKQSFSDYTNRYEELKAQQARFEPIGIYKYKDATEGYGWHADANDPGLRYRFVSVVLYLNTVEVGGETEFRYYDRKVKPEEGTLILFPSGWTHIHRALPPENDSKYVLVSWIRFAVSPEL